MKIVCAYSNDYSDNVCISHTRPCRASHRAGVNRLNHLYNVQPSHTALFLPFDCFGAYSQLGFRKMFISEIISEFGQLVFIWDGHAL